MLRILVIMAAIFAVFYFGGSFVKKYLNKKMINIFGSSFTSTPEKKKDEVIYKENDVVVMKGEAKSKDKAKGKNGR